MDEVKREAKRRKVELLILPTEEAMKLLNQRIDLGDHFKSGQQLSVQNRPTEVAVQD